MPKLLAAACAAALFALPAAARAQAETDLSATEIDGILARLVDPADMTVRATALTALLEAQAGALPLLTERLFRPNGITVGLQQRMLEDYVRRLPAELPPESPVPPRTALAPLLHLLILAPHEIYKEAWAAALQAVSLLAALDVIDTNDALMEAIRFVGQYEGAYARAVGLLVRAKGDRAIPALVRSRKVPSGVLKAFVGDQLARMGKERAPLMAQVNDDQLLADILRAIAEVRDSEGVMVMLSFINSDRPFVRQAARESLLLYERNAIWAVRQSYEDLTGERADTSWDWRETMDRLFAAQDAARLEPLDGLLTRGLVAAREQRWTDMDATFGAILGREPEYPRRAEMVPGLLAYGEQLLSKGDVLEARRVLRLAGYLAPEGDVRAARIKAHLAYLEGLRRRDLGFPDAQPFQEAAKLDPEYAKLVAARGDLAGLAVDPVKPAAATSSPTGGPAPSAERLPVGRIAAAAGILLTALAGLFLLISSGRLPGRLFGRPAPASAPPTPSATIARDPAPHRGLEPAAPRTENPVSAEGAAEPPSPPDAPPPFLTPTALVEETPAPEATRAARPDPLLLPQLEEPATPATAAPAPPPPDDPYRRIEAALARIRKDLPPEDKET